MSIIGSLLGWTKLPQWALELIIMGLLAGGLWYLHHRIYVEGVHAQQAADQKASAATLAKAHARDTAILNAQLYAYHTLETKYAAARSSDVTIASAFTTGLRRAYTDGRASTLSEITPPAVVTHGAPSGGPVDDNLLQEVGNVFTACAEDDAELTSLQGWTMTQLSLFNPEKSNDSAK